MVVRELRIVLPIWGNVAGMIMAARFPAIETGRSKPERSSISARQRDVRIDDGGRRPGVLR